MQAESKLSAETVIFKIKQHLYQACTLNFACMVHRFIAKINDTVSIDGFYLGLDQLEIRLTEMERQLLFKHFQKNWN